MNGIRRRRSRLFLLVLTLWAAVVVARLAQLQIAQGSRYRAKAQKQQERRLDIAAQRGSILDREGRELAVSVESTSVYAVPDEIEDAHAAARSLSAALDLKPAEALERLQSDKGFVWIRRQIDPGDAAKVRALKLRGIHLVPEPKRFYPKGHLASAVLGFVGTDNTGLAGLEHVYDKMIRGKPGELVALTDARRSLYGEAETARSRPAEAGASLVLSLDSGLQFAAERELAATIKEHRAASGSVVVMDPWNGEILAMASAPYFDPNNFQDAPPDARRNRVIADAYEPGSTFKIVTGSLALDNGLVSLDEWNRWSGILPAREAHLDETDAAAERWKSRPVTPAELDVLARARMGAAVGEILEGSPLPDADLAEAICTLMTDGILTARL